MANTFIKAEKIVNQGLGLLQRELVLPRLVTRKGIADFAGSKDDTVNISIPSILKARETTWRTRSGPITVDDLNEFKVAVKLDKHVYHAVGITDEELSLDIKSWGEQVSQPQQRAIAEKLEGYIAAAMENAHYRHTVPYAPPAVSDADDFSFQRTVNAARKFMNRENVPAAGRAILLGADVEERVLNSPHLIKVDSSGSEDAMREAVIGRLGGFTIYGGVNSIAPEFAVAFHPTAFGLANVAPEVPAGASAGATATYESLAMRWIRDYDSDYLRDRSVFSSFAGAVSIEDGRDLDSPVGSGYGELTNENVRAVLIDFTPATTP